MRTFLKYAGYILFGMIVAAGLIKVFHLIVTHASVKVASEISHPLNRI